MELSKITTVVRPRNKWQAVDLGFKMASNWYLPLLLGWLMVSLPVFMLLHLVFSEQLWLAMLLFWWLKPVWERIQLGYLSVALFGERPSLKQQLSQWFKVLGRQLLPVLTWRRLSLQRSYSAPIIQLENLSGSKRTQRRRLFEGSNQQAALWLTIVLVHFESFTTIATFALIEFLLPKQSGLTVIDLDFLQNLGFLSNLLFYIAMAVVSPFYVSSGFSLYLNQRTQIEGWDIEIVFKRMVERQQRKTQRRAEGLSKVLSVMLLSTLGWFSLQPIDVQANERPVGDDIVSLKRLTPSASPEQQSQQHSQQVIKKVLAGEQFNQVETHSYPEFFLDWEIDPQEQQTKLDIPQWLQQLLNFIAGSFELLLTALVVALVLLLVFRYRHWLRQFLPNPPESVTQSPPQTSQLFGLDVDDDSLPDDPSAAATALWQAGKNRQALSLLYRASLVYLVNNQHIEVHDSFTEGECVNQVQQNSPPPIADYFVHLTRNWQRLAYAGQLPSEPVMQQLLQQWSQRFKPSEIADEH